MPEHRAAKLLQTRFSGDNPVLVDVGAHAGAFSLPIANLGGPNTRTLMFKPNLEERRLIEQNIALNNLKNLTVFDGAISDMETLGTLCFPVNGNLGKVRVQKGHKGGSKGVDVRPLANCLTEAGVTSVDFLKVDV